MIKVQWRGRIEIYPWETQQIEYINGSSTPIPNSSMHQGIIIGTVVKNDYTFIVVACDDGYIRETRIDQAKIVRNDPD